MRKENIMPRLEKWSLTQRMDDPFRAPELYPVFAQGEIYNDIRFFDGTFITTSMIKEVDIDSKTLTTLNTVYELGEPSDEYKVFLKLNQIEF
jgi:hypothetical protein